MKNSESVPVPSQKVSESPDVRDNTGQLTPVHPPLSQDMDAILAYLATELFGWEYKDWTGFGEAWNQPLDSLLTGNWMLNIVEAMRDGKHGAWRAHLYVNGDCMAAFSRDDDEYAPEDYITHAQRTGLTLPEAVARAAHAALQREDVT